MTLEYLVVPWTPVKYEWPWHQPPREGPFVYPHLQYQFSEQDGFEFRGHAQGGEPGSPVTYLPLDLVSLLDPETLGKRLHGADMDYQLDADGALRVWPHEHRHQD